MSTNPLACHSNSSLIYISIPAITTCVMRDKIDCVTESIGQNAPVGKPVSDSLCPAQAAFSVKRRGGPPLVARRSRIALGVAAD